MGRNKNRSSLLGGRPVYLFLLIIFGTYVAIGYLYTTFLTPAGFAVDPVLRGNNPMDIALYYVAASVVRSGHADQLYNRQYLVEQAFSLVGQKQYVGWYIYPPVFAILMTPLTLINFFHAKLVWLLANQAMLFAGLYLLLKCTKNLPRLAKGAVVMLAMMSAPLIVNLQMGNVNVIIFFLLCLTLFLILRESSWLAGVPLGLAISIKLVPGLLLVYLLVKKKYLSLLSAVVTTLFLTVLGAIYSGWATTWAFFTDVLPGIGWLENGGDSPTEYTTINQSLHGLIQRLFTDAPDGFTRSMIDSKPTSIILTIGGILFLIIISSWVVSRKSHADDNKNFALGFGLFVLLAYIVSSISWVDHLVVVLIPLVMLMDWVDDANFGLMWFYALAAVGYGFVAANHPYDMANIIPSYRGGWRLLISPVLYGMLAIWTSIIIVEHRYTIKKIPAVVTARFDGEETPFATKSGLTAPVTDASHMTGEE